MLQVVKDKALSQVERANKSSVIEHLKDELRRTNCILDQQEQDVVRLRREADAARIELGKEKSLRQRNEDELRQQISKLEARTAELTATISKLAPLKRRS
jgi:biopolymer transport protein ExbB/TolQ